MSDDEAGPENLDTVERMTAFIEARQGETVARSKGQEVSEPRVR